MKKVSIVVIFLLLFSLFTFSCEKTAATFNEESAIVDKSNKEIYISIISKGWQHQFWQAVKMGAEKAAKEYGVKITFEGPEGDSAISKQIEMIDSALERKPNALVLAACDSKAVTPTLEKADAMGIPVIGFDSGIESDIPVTTVATDNISAAALAADKLAEAVGKEGEVAIICHDAVSVTGIARRNGFVDRIKEKYSGIKIVDIKYSGGDHNISRELTELVIKENPELKGIFATNEGAAYGSIEGVIKNNKGGIISIVGFDAGKLQKEAVRNKIMVGAIAQDPVTIGYKAVEAAYKTVQGEKQPAYIGTDFQWYDRTNIDDASLKNLLYD